MSLYSVGKFSYFRKVMVAFVVVSAVVMTNISVSSAHSANNDTLAVYYDAPFVQSSYVSGTANTLTETFDSTNTGTCPSSIAVGTVSGSCQVENAGDYGGAMSQYVGGAGAIPVGSPATGYNSTQGTGTRYASNQGNTLTLNLASNTKYFGLWWSAGSTTNTLDFYNGQNLVISLTTETIMSQFGSAPGTWPGSDTFAALDQSTTYLKGRYFGNPRGYTSQTSNPPPAAPQPTAASGINSGEPYVYLHLFAGGALTFDRVVLSGSGFEFDNVTVSTETKTPRSSLVLSQTIYGNHTVSYNNNQGTGSMADQVANSTTALSNNTFTRTGFAFTGWNTEANGSGTSYVNGADFDFGSDITLYAQWRDNSTPTPTPTPDSAELAATGSNTSLLLGGFGLATVGGLFLLAQAMRLRRS